ncbi:hypothetical protein [Nocardia paucivorans]|uniref:hypothetical protein n=1 Tax=Nocardia paucivorans TaxID=114259 RepID=UPI000317F08B|nr:hypothetical protein [Nocardia paucivorans]
MTDNLEAADRVIDLIDGAFADWVVSEDAMRWRPNPNPEPADKAPAGEVLADLRVGDVVGYHGSIRCAHGEYVLTTIGEDGRLTLRDHYHPDNRLRSVRPQSVTRTGDWVPVCRCEHPYLHPVTAPNGRCPRYGCACPHHPGEAAARTA